MSQRQCKLFWNMHNAVSMLMAACARTSMRVIRTLWYLLEGWREGNSRGRGRVGRVLLSTL